MVSGGKFLKSILLLILCLGISPVQVGRAQSASGATSISTSFGLIKGDFEISARLSSLVRQDMGIEVTGAFVPSRGDLSDLYTMVQYVYLPWTGKWIIPHLSGGAGATVVVGRGRRNTDFVASFGTGIEASLTGDLHARLDVEDYAVSLEDGWDNRGSFSTGIVFIF
jgi:hypothetical protein